MPGRRPAFKQPTSPTIAIQKPRLAPPVVDRHKVAAMLRERFPQIYAVRVPDAETRYCSSYDLALSFIRDGQSCTIARVASRDISDLNMIGMYVERLNK